MAEVTITVNQVTPEEITAKIDAFLKIADFLRVIDNKQVNAVLDFTAKISHKPFVPKLIALALEIYNESWASDVKTLKAGLAS